MNDIRSAAFSALVRTGVEVSTVDEILDSITFTGDRDTDINTLIAVATSVLERQIADNQAETARLKTLSAANDAEFAETLKQEMLWRLDTPNTIH